MDKNITAKLEYIEWNVYIDVYKRDKLIHSVEVTEEVMECALLYWINIAKTRLEWETMFSHPWTEYAMVIKKKDDVN